MKRTFATILFVIITIINIHAQRISSQQFMVRKITFSASDQIIPISGINVEINKAKFRSDKSGLFTANIPVTKDMGFYISAISAPGYIVAIPEDLKKKLYLSSNQCIIVLADINAVNEERNRIYKNNKAALAKQESRLQSEVEKNKELLSKIEKQENEYNSVLAELEKAKRQLDSFNKSKKDIESKIDSLAYDLSMVDYASLDSENQLRISKEKEGEWIEKIVDEVISKIESNLNKKYDKEIIEFERKIQDISNDYYKKFINGNNPQTINYFASRYYGYLNYIMNGEEQNKNKVFDKILNKILEDDVVEILDKHVSDCLKEWKVKIEVKSPDNLEKKSAKTLESAKEDFLSFALFPGKKDALYRAIKPRWERITNDEIFSVLKRVYPDFYNLSKKSSDAFIDGFNPTSEELYKFTEESKIATLRIEAEDVIKRSFNSDTNYPYHEFASLIISFSVDDSLEPLRSKYNECIDHDINQAINGSYPSIESMIPQISSEKHDEEFLTWDRRKDIDEYYETYTQLKTDYPEYTDFLYSIVLQFINPLKKKYDCNDALYIWESVMQSDINTYCFQPIKENETRLCFIPNVSGSDNKCRDIIRTIVAIEEDKIIIDHNERIKNFKENDTKEEQLAIEKLKNDKKGFDDEQDIIAFLVTHKFINKEFETSTWYDSKVSKMFMDFGRGESYYKICGYEILEWDKNSAKVKLKIENDNIPIIIRIQFSSTKSSYSESVLTETRKYDVINK